MTEKAMTQIIIIDQDQLLLDPAEGNWPMIENWQWDEKPDPVTQPRQWPIIEKIVMTAYC